MPRNLDDLLESIQVEAPGMWRNENGPLDWWAVSTDNDGIVAYFFHEVDACRFRLDLINLALNTREVT